MILDTRIHAMADTTPDSDLVRNLAGGLAKGARSAGMPGVGRAIESATPHLTLGKITGLSPWMVGMKTFAGTLAMDQLSAFAIKSAAGKAGKRELQKMARAGINTDVAERIAAQVQKYGDKDGMLNMPNTARWDDQDAARIMEAAIRSEVDFVTLEPGAADSWLSLSTEIGKLFGQFQSFLISMTNRGLVGGLQRFDVNYVTGVMSIIAFGAMVAAVKDMARGRDPAKRWRDDPEWAMGDAIERSGILGLYTHVYSTAAQLSGNTSSRYLGKDIFGTVLGPGLSGYGPAAGIEVANMLQGDPRGRGIAKLLPYNNLWHFRDAMERMNMAPYEVPR